MYKKHSTCNYLQPGLAAMHISRMCDLYKVAEEYKKASQNQIADGMQWWYKVHGAIAYDIPKSLSSWCSCTSSFFFNHACIFHVVIYCSAANKNIAIIIHRYKIRYTLLFGHKISLDDITQLFLLQMAFHTVRILMVLEYWWLNYSS